MSPLRFEITRDATQFAQRAESFLAAKIERNPLATVLVNTLSRHLTGVFATGLDDDGQVQAAAVRVSSWPLLATGIDAASAEDFVRTWLAKDPHPPAIDGRPDTARAIAAAWAAETGGRTRCYMREAFHVLDEVTDPPRPADGGLRVADPAERSLLIDWMRAFVEEAGVHGADQIDRTVDAQLAAGRLFVWDDEGPASLVSFSPTVAAVTRLGPVYTPPELRRRGYASSAVAAASGYALAHDAERCALLTDLANPTSNKIYAAVGYRRIADWEGHAFERGDVSVRGSW